MAVLQSDAPVSSRTRAQPWLWFNLLSIDAPLVAVVWQMWFAHCFGIALRPLSVAVLALTVWMIYATDRLLDVRGSAKCVPNTERHRFHHEHLRALSVAVVLSFLTLLLALWQLNPTLIRNGFGLAAIVVMYFSAVHLLPRQVLAICPKEMAVGIVFATGAALAPWSRLHRTEPFILPVTLFAMLCVLNCSAIESWEWKETGRSTAQRPHWLTLWFSQHLRILSASIAAAAFVLLVIWKAHTIFAPVIVSAIAFLWLDMERERLTMSMVRVLADLTLLSPLLLLSIH